MRCPTCLFGNLDETRFCASCGVPLPVKCPSCGGLIPSQFRFCGHCGALLGGSPAAAGPSAQPVRGTEGLADRRHLTVMFCDLVGSTALSERLDPEELRQIVHSYQRTAGNVVARFSGHVAQYLGDGLLIYFGYPQAHEDDARRAVYAGLGIIEAMKPLAARMGLHGVRLAVRLGIHSGAVVIGPVGPEASLEWLALGPAPNIAARVQALAEPDTLLVSVATYKLIEPYFLCNPLGPKTLKGVARPIEVYQVSAEKTPEASLDATSVGRLAPMVGRDDALSCLTQLLERSARGEGGSVLVMAEPGIGKSRLVQALREHATARRHTWVPGSCSPYEEASALSPFLRVLRRICRFQDAEGDEGKLRRLEDALAARISSPDALPLLAALLSLPPRQDWRPLDLSPQKQKQRTMECLVELLISLGRERPLVLCLEDLHWADPSSRELLELLAGAVEGAPVLLLLTARPSYDPSVEIQQRSLHITLERLGREEAEAVIGGITRGKALPRQVLEQLLAKADGVPLFLEELTRAVLESGELREHESSFELASGTVSVSIPDSLRGSLTARLDRLATVREVAKLGAVLGREFSYPLIEAVAAQDPAALQRDLDQLVRAELLFQRGRLPEATYIFKHALLQEAAYELLLRNTRQQYHQRIAEALVERFPQQAEVQPELVAQHFAKAGEAEPAVTYWTKAGSRAQRRSADLESIQHLACGLELLASLPAGPERDARELQLQTLLSMAYVSTRGYVAPEVERAYLRAAELCDRLEDAPERFWVLLGLRNFQMVRGSLLEAKNLDFRLLEMADARGETTLLAGAWSSLASSHFFLGDFKSAQEAYERGLALYPPDDPSFLINGGLDVVVQNHSYLALSLWHLGYPDRSLRHAHEAIAAARNGGHSYSLAVALVIAGLTLQQFLRDEDQIVAVAEEALAVCRRSGFPLWEHQGLMFQGWAVSQRGAGLERGEWAQCIEQGIAFFAGSGVRLVFPYFLGIQADALLRHDRLEEARMALDEAFAISEQTGERFWEADLYRLRGELAVAEGGESGAKKAEEMFQTALEVARGLGSRGLELRAAVSLGRLWKDLGRPAAARELLAPLYGWYQEGLDTCDLREARELLEACRMTEAAHHMNEAWTRARRRSTSPPNAS